MNPPYMLFEGIQRLAKEMTGTEKIHLGIRPFGFHAGNTLAMIVYPYLLCEELVQIGKIPKMEFFISINDYEQDALSGPNLNDYPFNICPAFTSLKFAKDTEHNYIWIDHWQPIIEQAILTIKQTFNTVTFHFVRNSTLKTQPEFKRLLLDTIQHPNEQAQILRQLTGKIILDKPLSYAGVTCPKCNSARGITQIVDQEHIHWSCDHCGQITEGRYEYFDYWWYHKPLLIARLKIYGIDITISGSDHFTEGDVNIRQAFIKHYYPKMDIPKMLFSPTIIGRNGLKMSKSKKNMEFALIHPLLEDVRGYNKINFYIEDKYIDKYANHENYHPIL